MQAIRLRCCFFILFALLLSPALADELLPAETPIAQAVDHYIDRQLTERDVVPASQADDATLIRRLTLDLVGRIPTSVEVRSYCESTAPDKREQLVDRLMASPAFIRHQATEFNSLLMEGDGSVRSYLLAALGENRPWDEIFRELLLPDRGDVEPEAADFLKQRVDDIDRLTNDVSVLFFGVNVSCAKCHDHPFVSDWTQDRFFGMKSFFNRTFENGGFIGERDYGLVSFETTEGETRQAELMFLTGRVLDESEAPEPSNEEKKKEKKQLEELKKKKQPPPAPKFSRRAQLIDAALAPEENRFFNRAVVNRVWHRLFGQGLVMPLDQMHAENPPTHPLLLAWLARDFAENGYDLRRLIRGLVLSNTYARTSRWEGDSRPSPWLFAVAGARPLAPQQYATALRVAAASPDQFPADLSPGDFDKRMENLENAARSLARHFQSPRGGFQVSVTEALLFSNSEQIARDLLRGSSDFLVGKLLTMEDDRQLIETAVWNVYGRPPTEEEVKALTTYLHDRQDRREKACEQIVWALLTSAPMRFNF